MIERWGRPRIGLGNNAPYHAPHRTPSQRRRDREMDVAMQEAQEAMLRREERVWRSFSRPPIVDGSA